MRLCGRSRRRFGTSLGLLGFGPAVVCTPATRDGDCVHPSDFRRWGSADPWACDKIAWALSLMHHLPLVLPLVPLAVRGWWRVALVCAWALRVCVGEGFDGTVAFIWALSALCVCEAGCVRVLVRARARVGVRAGVRFRVRVCMCVGAARALAPSIRSPQVTVPGGFCTHAHTRARSYTHIRARAQTMQA